MPSASLSLPRSRRRPSTTEHPQTPRADKYMHVLFHICRVSRSGSNMYFWAPTHRRSTHRRSNHPCSSCACYAIIVWSYAVAVKNPPLAHTHKHHGRIPCAVASKYRVPGICVMGCWGSKTFDALVIYCSHPGVVKACYMRAIPVATVSSCMNNY